MRSFYAICVGVFVMFCADAGFASRISEEHITVDQNQWRMAKGNPQELLIDLLTQPQPQSNRTIELKVKLENATLASLKELRRQGALFSLLDTIPGEVLFYAWNVMEDPEDRDEVITITMQVGPSGEIFPGLSDVI